MEQVVGAFDAAVAGPSRLVPVEYLLMPREEGVDGVAELGYLPGAVDVGEPVEGFEGAFAVFGEVEAVQLAERVPGPAPSSTVEVRTAAAILFARDPRQYVPGAAVQLVRRTGTGPVAGATSDRHECWGPLQTAFECCVEFIDAHTRTYEAVSGLFREPIPEYPHAVVREALLNALAHRDYGLIGATVDVTVWDDRVEIRSPGPLPGHITVDNMRREHFSRNRRLMRALRSVGLVEEFGEGVDRMYHQMETRLMLPPEFTATADSVTVTLRNQFLVDLEEQAWLLALEGWPGSAEERRVLVELRRRGEAAKRHLCEAMPNLDMDYILDRMRLQGLVDRIGRAGGTRYRLSADVIRRAGAPAEAEARRHSSALLAELQRVGSLSTAEAAKLLDIERTAARNMLNELAAAGKVRPVGNTRARRYIMIDDDAIMIDDDASRVSLSSSRRYVSG